MKIRQAMQEFHGRLSAMLSCLWPRAATCLHFGHAHSELQQGFLEGQALKQTITKSRPSGKHPGKDRPSPAYLALIDAFPLRPLRSERDYDAAAALLDAL